MNNEQEIVRSVFDAYIRDAKASSTKKDRPTFDMLEEVKNRAIKALEQPTSDDCVSRAEVLNLVRFNAFHVKSQIKAIENMPPVTPTHGTCKDCKHWDKEGEHCLHLSNDNGWFEDEYYRVYTESDFYCKDFKKRGDEE